MRNNNLMRSTPSNFGFRISSFRRLARGRGFSFAEVMFAVIILGVGFIMIASVFPVAIQETKTNSEESTAASVARGAADTLRQLGAITVAPALFPSTADQVVAITDSSNQPLFRAIKGNLIQSNDPRYSWAALYRRGVSPISLAAEPYAQVYVIVAQNRTQQFYVAHDAKSIVRSSGGNVIGNATFNYDAATQSSTVNFSASPAEIAGAAAVGAYLIVPTTGRIYRLGNEISAGLYELQPGNDMLPTDPSAAQGVFIVGRALRDPSQDFNATTNPFEGPAQDVAVYTTYIPVVQ